MTEQILIQREGPVLIAQINNPSRRNAITKDSCLGLSAAINEANNDSTVRALVITGDVNAFCAGADLAAKSERTATSQPMDHAATSMLPQLNALVTQIHDADVPVIAAVEGAAAGAGASLAFACDVVVAGEGAFFILPFGKIGLIPDGGISMNAVASLGRHRAMQLALLQDRMSLDEAVHAGLVTQRADRGAALDAALTLCKAFMQAPRGTLADTKRAINQVALRGMEAQLSWEEDTQYRLLDSAEHEEGVRAFMEKRPARFN